MAFKLAPRTTPLHKVVSHITDCVVELRKDFVESGTPINDDNVTLHRLCGKLEQALETGRKDRGLFSSRKSYWNYFCHCLANGKNVHDGLKFVKVNSEMKSSVGKGRGFIRFCLMHQCLADTLQRCFVNVQVSSEWYKEDSVPCKNALWSVLVSGLYDLSDIQFDLSPHGHDLDSGWPTFARKLFSSPSSSWRPPSRAMSLTSLNSTTSMALDLNSSITEAEDEEKIYLHEKVEQMKGDLLDLNATRGQLENTVTSLEVKLKEKEEFEENLKTQFENERKQCIIKADLEKDEWKLKESEFVNRIVEVEKQASEYTAKYECLRKERDLKLAEESTSKSLVSKLEASNRELELKLKLAEKDLETWQQSNYEDLVKGLRSEVSSLLDKNRELMQKHESLLDDSEAATFEYQKSGNQLHDVGEKFSNSEAARQNLRRELSETRDENKKLDCLNAQLKEYVEMAEGTKSDLISDLKTLENETSEYQAELIERNERIFDLEKSNEDLKIELSETIKHLSAEIDRAGEASFGVGMECSMCNIQKARSLSLSDQIDHVKKQLNSTELQKNELRQKFELLEREHKEMTVDLAEKDKCLGRRETEICEMNKSINSIDTILRKQESTIDDLEKKLKTSLEDNIKLNEQMKTLNMISSSDQSVSIPSQQTGAAEEARSVTEDGNDSVEQSTTTDGSESKAMQSKDERVNDGYEPSSDEPVLVTTACRTLSRLQSLVEEGEEICNLVVSAKEVSSTVINKVQEQEEKLKKQKEIIENSESMLTKLKEDHMKLLTSDSILRYELKQKRKMLENLKRELNASRNTWLSARRIQDESCDGWKKLQEEFSARRKQHSEESGFLSDDTKIPDANNVDSAVVSQSSSSDAAIDAANSFMIHDETSSSCSNSKESSPTIESYEARAQRSRDRLNMLEQQCQFLYVSLIQSSKKSIYLESKLNELLGCHDDGSDTEDNVESIDDVSDVSLSPPEQSHVISADRNPTSPDLNSENLEVNRMSEHNKFDGLDKPEVSGSRGSGAVAVQELLSPSSEASTSKATNDVSNVAKNVSSMNISDGDTCTLSDKNANVDIKSENRGSALVPDDVPFIDEDGDQGADSSSNDCHHDDQVDKDVSVHCRSDDNMVPEKVLRSNSETRDKSILIGSESSAADDADLRSQLAALLKQNDVLKKKEAETKRRADFILRNDRDQYERKIRMFEKEKIGLQREIDLQKEELLSTQRALEAMEKKMNEDETTHDIAKTSLEQEISSLRFQLSTEVIRYDHAVKGYTEQETNINGMKDKISDQEQLILFLEETLRDIQDGREMERTQLLQELQELQLALSTRDEECSSVTEELKIMTKVLDEEKNKYKQLQMHLAEMKMHYHHLITKQESELSDLKKDNRDLMDKLIKLIRDKDFLWQKTDRLADLQKSSVAGRWMSNNETKECLGCKAEFSLLLRKHHCRLCGRIFCHSCANNWIMIASSSQKSRVCNTCANNQGDIESMVTSSHNMQGSGSEEDNNSTTNETNEGSEVSFSRPGRARSMSESNSMNESTSPKYDFNNDEISSSTLTVDSMDGDRCHRSPMRCHSAPPNIETTKGWSCEHNNQEDSLSIDDFQVISDEEISRSLSGASPYHPKEYFDSSFQMATMKTVADIEKDNWSNESLPEVWINAGGSYTIPILIEEDNLSLFWEFTTEPKSIAFSVQFRETDEELDSSEIVMQPLLSTTRCKSHIHPIHGSIKVRRRGIYTLLFDNRFSMIMAKKVKCKLRIMRRLEF